MRKAVRFIRRGELVEVSDAAPTDMLLDYLREREQAKGTKEACREGDCGACTVALGRLRRGRLVYEPVNACITMLGQVDGAEVVTVEDLAAADGTLHPIQQAFVDQHASQCGFCTPGFVMALFTLFHQSKGSVSRAVVNDQIAGNLCRCTGYRPIVAAALSAMDKPRTDQFAKSAGDTEQTLAFLADEEDLFVGDGSRFFAAPATIDGLANLCEQYPDATIVSGATDVGLWVTKQRRVINRIIHTGRTAGFADIEDTGLELIIGAGASLHALEGTLGRFDPDLAELLRRFASPQVRTHATIGGNVANGSPIGDLPPVLIALGAVVHLRKGEAVRTAAMEDFFVDYGKQDREAGELITSISVPHLGEGHRFRCYKVSKRFDQDIASVMGAFRFAVTEDGMLAEVRLAYGGMAATPRRATAAETALTGAQLRDSVRWADAFNALRQDFAPIDDHRASARYRLETAHALLGKALIELAGTESRRTRIIGRREAVTHEDA
ncbi:MAG: xanthine dehydrogenase small subunit [Alphaproteobacteria bacterium]